MPLSVRRPWPSSIRSSDNPALANLMRLRGQGVRRLHRRPARHLLDLGQRPALDVAGLAEHEQATLPI
jgi:hypothetical protein